MQESFLGEEMSEQELAEMLRSAIRDSGKSLSQIARESGVSQPQLTRFLSGERSLTLTSAASLFDCFGIKVEPPAKAKPAKKKPRKK